MGGAFGEYLDGAYFCRVSATSQQLFLLSLIWCGYQAYCRKQGIKLNKGLSLYLKHPFFDLFDLVPKRALTQSEVLG